MTKSTQKRARHWYTHPVWVVPEFPFQDLVDSLVLPSLTHTLLTCNTQDNKEWSYKHTLFFYIFKKKYKVEIMKLCFINKYFKQEQNNFTLFRCTNKNMDENATFIHVHEMTKLKQKLRRRQKLTWILHKEYLSNKFSVDSVSQHSLHSSHLCRVL